MAKHYKPLYFLISLLLVAGLFGPALPSSQNSVVRAQPVLVEMAASNPDQIVSVIVQKTTESAGLEGQVLRLGGQVTKDLGIINAFVAEMRVTAAMEMARSDQVRWVSLDAAMVRSGGPIDTSKLESAYIEAIGADRVWNTGPGYLQGEGITVAVVDSGDCTNNGNPCDSVKEKAKASHVIAATSVLSGPGSQPNDLYGHGSLVEGVVGGTGLGSGNKYLGVAPGVNLVSVKVTDNLGMATASDVVKGLQWVLDNKETYNIRVVNLSLNSSVAESYHTSPLAAACEILWFNGIVVVVSAGNNGTAALYAPANDPFVITVGATDDRGTGDLSDDVITSFSAYGITEDGFAKPDLVAPGKNIISIVPRTKNKIWKDHRVNRAGGSSYEYYMRVSGTSFSAPMVAGAVALLLQGEPNLTPDQVKYRLMTTARKTGWDYNDAKAGAGYLDIYAAVNGTSIQSANIGVRPSQLLSTGTDPIAFGSVGWNSVGWNSVGWNSVGWNSVGWNSVGWNSDYWGP